MRKLQLRRKISKRELPDFEIKKGWRVWALEFGDLLFRNKIADPVITGS